MGGVEKWVEWGKVEEGLEWRNSGSGGMGKEEEWLEWGMDGVVEEL